MNNLDRLLTFLEENIDLEHCKKVEQLHLDAMSYQNISFIPLTVICQKGSHYTYQSLVDLQPYPYIEAFDNPEKMMFNELLWSFSSIVNSVKLKDYFPYQIRSNHGIGIINSMFSQSIKLVNNDMPWVEPVENGMDSIKKIIKKGIPDFKSGLGGKVLETHQFYIDKLKEYPKCDKAIHVTQPDMQGPFDIAHLMLGSDVFYEVYDNEDILLELLDLIAETYIGYRKFIEPYLTDKAGGKSVYVHGAIYGGKVIIKDDTAMINLSKPQYEKFSQAFNRKILDEFTGSIHYCGQEREWHHQVLMNPSLKTVQYGNPEMHDIDYDYTVWSKKKIPIVFWGYNQGYEFIQEALNKGIKTGMTFACRVDTLDEGKRILDQYINAFPKIEYTH